MEKRINVAELLKDCPSGMELDCTIMENVYFDEVLTNSIKCYFIKNGTKTRSTVYFNIFGEYFSIDNAKCVIFPKGRTTWEGFVPPYMFKDGDVVVDIEGAVIIYKEITTSGYCGSFVSLDHYNQFIPHYKSYLNYIRLATEEEEAKLFKAIKDNGYKWNAETKTLERLVKPRFKVGDEIVQRNSISNSWIVNSVNSEYYGLKLYNGFDGIGVLPISKQDDWELITNKLERSVEPKFKVGDVIQDEDAYKVTIVEVNVEDKFYGYESTIAKGIGGIAFSEQDNWKLVSNKFDITTLKPFESKVLVRTNNGKWVAAFYSHYDKDVVYLHYCVVGGLWYEQCIPYKGNEYLLNTKDDCSEYYKTWK